jgi:hypothetical protein
LRFLDTSELPRVDVPGVAGRIPGFLFADDVCVLAESPADLPRGLYVSSTARVKFHRCLSADAFRTARHTACISAFLCLP